MQTLEQSPKERQKLSMKSYIPILQCSTKELTKELERELEDTPNIEIKKSKESINLREFARRVARNISSKFDSDSATKELPNSIESLYEKLYMQIDSKIFPTPISIEVARIIVEHIDIDGYFDGDVEALARESNISALSFERIRERFSLLDPPGVGAKDYKEAMIFQLQELEIEDELYNFTKGLIELEESSQVETSSPLYKKAKSIIKRLKIPPALDFLEDSRAIIPELFITKEGEQLKVSINSNAYPEIVIKDFKTKDKKIQKAKSLFSLIELRKNTLLKIGEIIAQRDYGFFTTKSDPLPLKMADVAEISNLNQSTISRAIAHKYLSCEHGIFPLKHFFMSSLGDTEITPIKIKHYILELIKSEKLEKVLSDDDISKEIEREFSIKLARRTIGKYRDEIGVENKKVRKERLKSDKNSTYSTFDSKSTP